MNENRLLLGQSHLTHSYLPNKHPAPSCKHCKCVLTIEHILRTCTKYEHNREQYFHKSQRSISLRRRPLKSSYWVSGSTVNQNRIWCILASKYVIWRQAMLSVCNMQLRNIGMAKCIVCATNCTVGKAAALPVHFVPTPLSTSAVSSLVELVVFITNVTVNVTDWSIDCPLVCDGTVIFQPIEQFSWYYESYLIGDCFMALTQIDRKKYGLVEEVTLVSNLKLLLSREL